MAHDPFRPHESQPATPWAPQAPKEFPLPAYTGTIGDILSAVGSDKIRAAEALATEQIADKPRKSLIDQLNRIVHA